MPRTKLKTLPSILRRERPTAIRPPGDIIALARRAHRDGQQHSVPLLELWARGWGFEEASYARPNGRTVFATNRGILRLERSWHYALGFRGFADDCRDAGELSEDDDAFRRLFYRHAVVGATIPGIAPPQVGQIIDYHRKIKWGEKEFQHTTLELLARGYFMEFAALSHGIWINLRFSSEALRLCPTEAYLVHIQYPMPKLDWTRLQRINDQTWLKRGRGPPPKWRRWPQGR